MGLLQELQSICYGFLNFCRLYTVDLFLKLIYALETREEVKKIKESEKMPSVENLKSVEVRVLTLNDKEHLDSTLYRLEKNWIIQFRLGPSLYGKKVLIYTNYPPNEEFGEFVRNQYHLLPWYHEENCKFNDDTSSYCEIELKRAGSFHYYFVSDIDISKPCGSGFFLVDPILKYGKNEELNLDCIQCQTVISKQLGPLNTWESKLKVAKETGYNMIHFTPIQQLGLSNSAYSLSDQLKLNSNFQGQSFNSVEKLIQKMRQEWKVTSICDIVLNHTANESPWLQNHPEATYNCNNCPHLRPAYLLDAALHILTLDIEKGNYETKGIPKIVNREEHLQAIRHVIFTEILPQINIQEMYLCDVNKLSQEFLNLSRNRVPPISGLNEETEELKLIPDQLFRRFRATVDMNLALRIYNIYRIDCFDEETRLRKCSEEFKKKLEELNKMVYDDIFNHLLSAVDNSIASMRYFRIDNNGPKIQEVSVKNPLVCRYFTDWGTPQTITEYEGIMYSPEGRFLMAHNGWVMDSDPLKNFAASDSNVYIRRELIAWGDSVKLRYGEKPEDCPFLWQHMKQYVETTAKIFDGVRLDNCHSTPIVVAEYMLDAARKIRPDLYVVAELFTNSDQKDNIFVNRLGITSLIREAMSAWDPHELGRLVYRFGGAPVGGFYHPSVRPLGPAVAHALFLDQTHDNPSAVERRSVFDLLPTAALVSMACCASGSNRGYDELVPHHGQKALTIFNRQPQSLNSLRSPILEALSAWDPHELGRLVYRFGGAPVGGFYHPSVRPLGPAVAHALFLDQTHDNPSAVERRSVFDLLPTAALVAMACCASGSNRGYDELVPHHIHVVDETRQYTEWNPELGVEDPKYVNSNTGIITAKKALNKLHFFLGSEGFTQVFVDQITPEIVAVTRHCPESHQSVVLVAYTAFSHPELGIGEIKPLKIEGEISEVILEASIAHKDFKNGGHMYQKHKNFDKNEKYVNGLNEYFVDIRENFSVEKSKFLQVNSDENVTHVHFKGFKPGSVVAIRISLKKPILDAIYKLRELITSFANPVSLDQSLMNIVSQMDLLALNRALYRCDEEEKDEGKGFGVYNVPNFGPLVYCGLQGFLSVLSTIRTGNDLGHAFCNNLREGNWMIDYIWQRLKLDPLTLDLGNWLEKNLEYLKTLPRYLIPCYFDVLITGTYLLLIEQCYSLMSTDVQNGSAFVRSLALGSVQCCSIVKSAILPKLSPNLTPNLKLRDLQMSLSAGLPHFTVGYMRNWGRDTFISLRGLLLLTGRYEEARQHILAYAACLRHGLIPNLLDGGKNARFNCRDSVWFWLYTIQLFCRSAPLGLGILQDKVSRVFPTDESPPLEISEAPECPLYQIMQEALNRHFQGVVFRERNAGRKIDEHMSDRGFNIQIGVNPETGFVFGGNESNCGTWMDKMGSSDKAGNRGKPATPRDGSAVELVALSKATVTWLAGLHAKQKYPYEGVQRKQRDGTIISWTFKQWGEKIQNNFEKCFFVSQTPNSCEKRPDLVNKRGIYKDSYGATQPWADYQLRCNFPIAMVVAPELFESSNAWTALQKVEKLLVGPLGMKTLDPEDWAYNGDYDNSNDSTDPKVAHGFNYHQGPEWIWPLGYFLRAKLLFALQNNDLKRTISYVKSVLSKHFTELQTSPWRGLPELTNSDGKFCPGSCRVQAWSMACILEVLYDLQQLEEKNFRDLNPGY